MTLVSAKEVLLEVVYRARYNTETENETVNGRSMLLTVLVIMLLYPKEKENNKE